MLRRGDLIEAACWTLDVDEETGQPFWRGGEILGKEETRLDAGRSLIMDPLHFPPGTRVDVFEPWDPVFYAKLFDDLERGRESGG